MFVKMTTRGEVRGTREPSWAALALLCLLALPGTLRAQGETAVVVGQLEGDDVSVRGQVSLVREAGRRRMALASGSEVTVRSGGARIVLADGSEIDVCGPAQFSVLKAGEAITVAVSYGRVHARLSSQAPVTVFTPTVVATPISVGGRPRDLVLGAETSGAVCAYSAAGALRLEHQLEGGNIVVPQGGEVALSDGRLDGVRDAPEACRCNPVLGEDREPQPARPVQISSAAKPAAPEKKAEELPTAAREVPTWHVLMPPLTFDASAPAPPPEPTPEAVVFYREARAVNAVVLTGRVEEKKEAPAEAVAAPAPATQAQIQTPSPGFFGRIGGFFRRLFGGKPKG